MNSLFRAQRGAKGTKKSNQSKDEKEEMYKYALRGSILPSPSEYDNFLKKAGAWDPLYIGRQELKQKHMEKAVDWMKLLIKNFNVLLYGFGCKYGIVEDFTREWLIGEDVVRIMGTAETSANSNRLVKALLDTISNSILCSPDIGSNTANLVSYAELVSEKLSELYGRSSSLPSTPSLSFSSSASLPMKSSISEIDEDLVRTEDDASSNCNDYKAKSPPSAKGYRYDMPRLYIVVHEIDGEALRSALSQHVLSILASCDSVSMIATFDCINTTLSWTQHTLCSFNWTYHHISTYESYTLSNTPHLSEWNKTSVANNKSLEFILKSLTPRHKEVLMLLVYDALKRREAATKGSKTDNKQPSSSQSSETGMAFETLYRTCADLLLVRSNQELKILLSELSDHRIISTHADPSKRGVINLNLPIDVQIQLAAANS